MIHLGDIRGIDGRRIPPVDVITGGSPCQDLSVAGKGGGLDGERSGLFREQMRVVREMYEKSGGVCPRFMVWENVLGALSSNHGEDFREVLSECVKVCEKKAPYVPMPKDGRWPKSGVLYDDLGRWSIAWRVHDAQFWGVAQRRRRIALVCDFGGMSAPEVLFEPGGVQRNFDQGNPQREKITGKSFGSSESSDRVRDARGNGNGQLCATLTGDHDNRITDYTNVVVERHGIAYGETESSAESHPIVIDRAAFRQGKNAKFDIKIEETETAPTLVACGPHAVAQPVQYRVRRLTPLECTRLQGYPDGWVDIGDWIDSKGKKHKEADAPKYKALGNSIAIPFWRWLMYRIYGEVKKLEPAPVLGSLFDGIGGFPLCWPGETAWSSEIDEFPLAVLRAHFGC